MDFAQHRAEAEEELAALRALRGQCLLDGKTFEHQKRINQLVHGLEALTEAEGVAGERERDAAEQRRLQRLAELRGQLDAEWQDQIKDAELAEMATRSALSSATRGSWTG